MTTTTVDDDDVDDDTVTTTTTKIFRQTSYFIQSTYNCSQVWFDLIRIVATYGNSPTTTYKSIHQVIQSIRVLIQFYFDIVFQHTMIHSKEQIQNKFINT